MSSFNFYFVLCFIVGLISIVVEFGAYASKSDTSSIQLELTSVMLSPSNVDLENKIRQQFLEFKTIQLSYLMGEIDFQLTVSCVSDCPSKWTFDNMQFMYETGYAPHIFPSRIFGNISHHFKLDLKMEASMSNNSFLYYRRASLLTGKYTCECLNSTSHGKHFYGYFHSDQLNTFVNAGRWLTVGPRDADDIWLGLGCATQTPNASPSLLVKKPDSQWETLIPGEHVRRDKSQGFKVDVDSISPRGADYMCRDENSPSIVQTTVLPRRTDPDVIVRVSIPVLIYNRTDSIYECCQKGRSEGLVPFVSFVSCNNLDECNFIANRRFGSPLSGGKCIEKPSFGQCCTYSAPRVWGLLRCHDIYEKPFISSNMIVNDSRNISRKPQIQSLKNENYLLLECTASSFTFSNNLHWIIQLKNGSTLSLNNHLVYTTQNSTRDEKDGTIKSAIKIPNEMEVDKVSCLASLIGSRKWESETHFVEQIIDAQAWNATVLVVFLTVPFVGTIVILYLIRRFVKPPPILTEQDIKEFMNGVLPNQTQLTEEVLEKNIREREHCDYYCNLLKLPYNEELEFSRSCFTYDKKSNKLGEGAFGVVYPGVLNIAENKPELVAIKMVLSNVTRDKMKSMLAEIKIMSYIGLHPNVVSLKGAFTRNLRKGKIMMAVELCSQGSLYDFITKNRKSFNVGPYFIFGTRDLIKWASDIANGMEFLSSKKVVHMDLATRNIFLTSSFVPKIGDFGLSRKLYTKEMYKKKLDSEGYFPIHWMSLESLKTLTFSMESDIWSYGIILWEMFTLCQEPYRSKNGRELNWDELVLFLRSGRRLSKPDLASLKIYEMMLQCWYEDPFTRPSFPLLKQFFRDELNKFSIIKNLKQNPPVTLMANLAQSNSNKTTRFLTPVTNISMNPVVNQPYVAPNFLDEDLKLNGHMTCVKPITNAYVSVDYDTLLPNSCPTSNIPENISRYVSTYFVLNSITNPQENEDQTMLNIKQSYVSSDFISSVSV